MLLTDAKTVEHVWMGLTVINAHVLKAGKELIVIEVCIYYNKLALRLSFCPSEPC